MENKETLLDIILTIASDMLQAGMEVRSVEEETAKMCCACEMEEVQVFTITSSILVSAKDKQGHIYTQSKRIKNYKTDFSRLEQLNKLASNIAEYHYGLAEIKKEVRQISDAAIQRSSGSKNICFQYGLYSSISFVFSLFFGGTMMDGFAACICGIVIRSIFYLFEKTVNNRFLLQVMVSAAGGVTACLLCYVGIADSVDKVIIGNIMLLIPGLAAVNACKDLIGGEMLSGVLRLVDACVIAVAVALGFSLALFIF